MLASIASAVATTARAGVAPTTLPQQANIVAHWSADSLSQADASDVSTWTDSINSIAATNAVAGKYPKYYTNVMGGKPSVRFDGSNDRLLIGTPGALHTAMLSQVNTVMCIYQQRANTTSTYGQVFSTNNAYWISDNNRIQRSPMVSSSFDVAFGSAYHNTFTSFCTTSGAGPRGVGLERLYINGGCTASYPAKTTAPTNSTSYCIGGASWIDWSVNADIFELIFWDRELTPAEVKQAHKFFANKYSQANPWDALSYFTVFHGDSITEGVSPKAAQHYPNITAASLGLTYGQWDNLGIGYMTMPEMTSTLATDVTPIATITGKPLKLASWEWYNQKAAHPTPYNNSLAYLTAARAAGHKIAFGTSTDTSLASDTNRANYNAAFDSNHGTDVMDAYVAIHNDAFIGVETAWATYPNPPNAYFATDGVHLLQAGNEKLAALFVAGLQAIP